MLRDGDLLHGRRLLARTLHILVARADGSSVAHNRNDVVRCSLPIIDIQQRAQSEEKP